MQKPRLDSNGWVLVADSEKALFLRNEGDAIYPNLRVFQSVEQLNPPSRDLGSDRPGRMGEVGMHISGVADTDWHRLNKARFAAELAETLYRHAHKSDFSQLVIVAPPMVLGELRKALHGEVKDRLIAEIEKDLTAHPVDQIERLVLGDKTG